MLIPADFRTSTWERLEAHLQDLLTRAREENDNRLDEVKTAALRGRISVLKDLLALPAKAAPAQRDEGRASGSFDAFPSS